MARWMRRRNLLVRIRTEWRHLSRVNDSDRLWQMPFAAALALGLPLLIGAYSNHMDYGLVSSLGGLVFLYLPETPMSHRMVSLMTCAFGMSACYAFGALSHFFPLLIIVALAFIAMLVTMICRFYRLGPPGSLFFIMAAAIGAYSPGEVAQIPLKVGLLTLGCLLACLIAFFYSLYALRLRAPKPVAALPQASFDFVVFDSVIIGVFVGLSLFLAQMLHLQRAYWVPMSCLAVIQGMSLRAVWNRQIHRVVGTGVGLWVAWLLLMLPLDKWSVSLLMMALAFLVEVIVVRHYGFAAVLFTPLAILLAEATALGHGSATSLIQARFFDTVLGCAVGFAGGFCLHSPRFRAAVGRPLRGLIPARFMQQ